MLTYRAVFASETIEPPSCLGCCNYTDYYTQQRTKDGVQTRLFCANHARMTLLSGKIAADGRRWTCTYELTETNKLDGFCVYVPGAVTRIMMYNTADFNLVLPRELIWEIVPCE